MGMTEEEMDIVLEHFEDWLDNQNNLLNMLPTEALSSAFYAGFEYACTIAKRCSNCKDQTTPPDQEPCCSCHNTKKWNLMF